jgi:hypothetical protein
MPASARRLVITSTLPAGGAVTKTSCDVFFLSDSELGEPFIFNKHMLMCLSDMPLQCAAAALGVHKNSLARMRERFGLDKWPYVEVMRGNYMGISRVDVVNARQSLISDLKEEIQRIRPAKDRRVEHTLMIMRYAESKAKLFWAMSSSNNTTTGCGNEKSKDNTTKKGAGKKKQAVQTVQLVGLTQEEDEGPSEAVQSTFWPLITDQINFDPLFEVEDVLDLGPIEAKQFNNK